MFRGQSDNHQYQPSSCSFCSLCLIVTTLLAKCDSTQLRAWLTRDSQPIPKLCAHTAGSPSFVRIATRPEPASLIALLAPTPTPPAASPTHLTHVPTSTRLAPDRGLAGQRRRAIPAAGPATLAWPAPITQAESLLPPHGIPVATTSTPPPYRCVGALQPFHPAEEIGFRGFQQKVIVIAHQGPRMNPPASTTARFAHGGQPRLPVSVVRADLLPLVSSSHDVINRSRIFNTYRSRPDCIQHNNTMHPAPSNAPVRIPD